MKSKWANSWQCPESFKETDTGRLQSGLLSASFKYEEETCFSPLLCQMVVYLFETRSDCITLGSSPLHRPSWRQTFSAPQSLCLSSLELLNEPPPCTPADFLKGFYVHVCRTSVQKTLKGAILWEEQLGSLSYSWGCNRVCIHSANFQWFGERIDGSDRWPCILIAPPSHGGGWSIKDRLAYLSTIVSTGCPI